MINQPNVVRAADGTIYKAAVIGPITKRVDKKLLVVIQYWHGDMQPASELADLIADLERIPNQEADIMIFGRWDAPDFPIGSVSRLREKFGTVHVRRCRRLNSPGYPFGSNQMFFDLVQLLGESQWKQQYFGFINLESDCVPTRPGWINELILEAKREFATGKLAVGHINEKPVKHLNGVAVYSSDLCKVFGPAPGGGGNNAYDIYHADKILPVAQDSPLVYLNFNLPTITAEDLFSSKKSGVFPALFHGVKDASARTAVRAKHIKLDGERDLSEITVFTFFDNTELNANEQKAQIEIWKDAWRSRGWNPVVLGPLDVMKHLKYEEFRAAVEKFPTVNPKKYELVCYLRWLALSYVGGGLMTDYDVIPGTFIPRDMEEIRKEKGMHVLQSNGKSVVPAAVFANKQALAKWLTSMATYKLDDNDKVNGSAHTSDQQILNRISDQDWIVKHEFVKEVGEDGWKGAKLVHFSAGACAKHLPGTSKSALMTLFLQS